MQGFLLNRCLVHNSITKWYWSYPSIDGPPPPLHVHQILAELPNLLLLQDIDKRLTLQHANDSNTASYEVVMNVFEANPKAASVHDPVTNLYPFTLAGMHGNTDALLRLLFANPTLIAGGYPAEGNQKLRSKSKRRTRRRRRRADDDVDRVRRRHGWHTAHGRRRGGGRASCRLPASFFFVAISKPPAPAIVVKVISALLILLMERCCFVRSDE